MMNEVVLFGTGQRARELGRPAAGKTGTTNDYLDAWFIGFTPTVVTGVWIGYDDQRSLGSGETGANAALPVWLDFMSAAAQYYPPEDFKVPDGIVFVPIDPKTGRRTSENAPGAITEAFISGTEPKDRPGQTGPTVNSQSEFLKEDFE
jgi:penicillin-binding protein 1A